MNEWRIENLEKNLEVILDYRGKTPKKSAKGIITLSAKSVKMNYIDYSNIYYVSQETYNTFMTRGFPKKGDILLTTEAPLGCVAELPDDKFCLAQRLLTLRGNPKFLVNKYLLYYLQSDYGQHELLSRATGTTVQGIKRTEFSKVNIKLPPLNIQKKIAKILSDIDEKIELNNKINNNLEKQVQLIFNNHFFNKDKNYTNYISSNLLEIADFLNGLAMQKYTPNDFNEKSYPVLKIKELNQGFTDKNSDRCSNKIKPEYIINNGDIIFSWSGTLLIKIWCGNKCGLNQHLFKVTSKKYDKWFYFLWINYHLKKFISIAKDKATTMGHIKRADLEKAFVLIPPEKEYESLNKILTPLFENIISNKKENNHLVNLKNYLLPKLMNGEIDIENIEL
ncbi:restriction endonuclease subunit S [uncultured Fusobacterium sp.]|uniref:restriction endonuclease subunit S n=1 Tax=uncultured Fusobacterium sp. TaxID=159267 RepID=UPI0025E6FD2D|nr:restriction endonuclease subunit S [uncultured Fusobacterium sp.]